jgi:hypothetical protein
MKPPRHVYLDDSTKDHRGEGRCRECGTPRSNERHELPERSEEERQTEMRRMGEPL